jgi:hypothetical protein
MIEGASVAEQMNMSTPRQPLKWGIIAASMIAALVCWWYGGTWYIRWYDATIPVVRLPIDAQLVARSQSSYYSSIARYWYYAKYSTDLPYAEARRFYTSTNDGESIGINCFDASNGNRLICSIGESAAPFGYALIAIVPPTKTLPSDSRTQFREPALRRDASDPPGKTLLFVEVAWTPLDRTNVLVWWFCGFPLIWILVAVVVVGHALRSHAGSGQASPQRPNMALKPTSRIGAILRVWVR